VALDIKADGLKQVLHISPYNPERSVYKPRQRSNSTISIGQGSFSSASDAFEAIPEQTSLTMSCAIDFAGIGISIISQKLVEVLYISLGNIKFDYANSPISQAVNLSCGNLQIDNQLHDAIFPVVLQPTPIPKGSVGVAPLPTVQASVIWLHDTGGSIFF
jgi:vacuolar protein sorting-associated protein 13A/C